MGESSHHSQRIKSVPDKTEINTAQAIQWRLHELISVVVGPCLCWNLLLYLRYCADGVKNTDRTLFPLSPAVG
jgi:hypothetical protein